MALTTQQGPRKSHQEQVSSPQSALDVTAFQGCQLHQAFTNGIPAAGCLRSEKLRSHFHVCIKTVYYFVSIISICLILFLFFDLFRVLSHVPFYHMLPLWSMVLMVLILSVFALQRRLALAAVPAHATRARRTSRVTKGLPDKSNQRITQNLSKFKTARQNWKKTLKTIIQQEKNKKK